MKLKVKSDYRGQKVEGKGKKSLRYESFNHFDKLQRESSILIFSKHKMEPEKKRKKSKQTTCSDFSNPEKSGFFNFFEDERVV